MSNLSSRIRVAASSSTAMMKTGGSTARARSHVLSRRPPSKQHAAQ